jgi:hypothetical protein
MFYMNFNFDSLVDAQAFAQKMNKTDPARFTVVNVNCVRHSLAENFQFNILVDMDEPALQQDSEGIQYKNPREVMMQGETIDGRDWQHDN